ncbi:MAG: D-alanyl-D-alanine carboxypeptidase/D-alanyl-D-alanine endopeptidase [Akkermansiaceae bacterium]
MRWLCLYAGLIEMVMAGSPIEELVADPSLKTASVGVLVVPLEGDEVVAEWQPDVALIPASTMKAITTATALQKLGEDYMFKTNLSLAGDDLVIKGGGDPVLGGQPEKMFSAWMAALEEAGLEKIEGDIIADATRFEDRTVPDSWPWGDVGNYYGAGPSGLNFRLNIYALTFQPGEEGERAELLSAIPEPPGVEFINEMRTGGPASGDQGYAYGGPGAEKVWLRGTVPAGGNFTIYGALPDPPLSCAVAFKSYLEEHEFEVMGEARVDRGILDEAKEVFVQKSPPLKAIASKTNHRSINLFADSLFKALSVAGSTEDSEKILRKHWEDQDVDLTGFVLHDGSGLSPRNSVTARQMVSILKKARGHETGEAFLQTLPVAGKSGTLVGFGRGTSIEGKVRAKSGGLTRVKTYAGFLTAESGKEYVFAVFSNNSVENPGEALVGFLEKLVKSL